MMHSSLYASYMVVYVNRGWRSSVHAATYGLARVPIRRSPNRTHERVQRSHASHLTRCSHRQAPRVSPEHVALPDTSAGSLDRASARTPPTPALRDHDFVATHHPPATTTLEDALPTRSEWRGLNLGPSPGYRRGRSRPASAPERNPHEGALTSMLAAQGRLHETKLGFVRARPPVRGLCQISKSLLILEPGA